ncbi:unnamed protein product [Ectocarpus sp. 12 AP-2014]
MSRSFCHTVTLILSRCHARLVTQPLFPPTRCAAPPRPVRATMPPTSSFLPRSKLN